MFKIISLFVLTFGFVSSSARGLQARQIQRQLQASFQSQMGYEVPVTYVLSTDGRIFYFPAYPEVDAGSVWRPWTVPLNERGEIRLLELDENSRTSGPYQFTDIFPLGSRLYAIATPNHGPNKHRYYVADISLTDRSRMRKPKAAAIAAMGLLNMAAGGFFFSQLTSHGAPEILALSCAIGVGAEFFKIGFRNFTGRPCEIRLRLNDPILGDNRGPFEVIETEKGLGRIQDVLLLNGRGERVHLSRILHDRRCWAALKRRF